MSQNRAYADVVIVAYNSADVIRRCIEPLAADPDLNVIVVDNASPDDVEAAVAGLAVTVVKSAENRGFGGGCNLGWRGASAPHVVFLNPDARISADGVKRLVAELRDEQVGLVGPKLRYEDGTIQHSQHRFPKHSSTWMQALFLNRLAPRSRWAHEDVVATDAYENVGEPDWIGGTCIALRREHLERLDGFDERFFMYGEDMDLCRRLRVRGLLVRYLPDVVAVHEGGRSAPAPRRSQMKLQSRIVFARIHSSRLGYLDFVLALMVGQVARLTLDFRHRNVHAYGLMGIVRGVILTLPLVIAGGG